MNRMQRYAAALGWIGRRGGLARYYVYAGVMALTAVGLVLRGYELFDRLVLGTAVPGALFFSRFLHRYPRSDSGSGDTDERANDDAA
jgi:hypothetical protein